MPLDRFGAPIEGFVFVVTYGRSGSTVLQNLLNQFPGYLIRGENHNALRPLAESWLRLRDSTPLPEHRKTAKITGPTHPWHGAELMDVQSYGHDLAAAFCRNVLQPGPGTRVVGFKEIRWHKTFAFFETYLNFVYMFFPGTKFVFNTRDFEGLHKSGWWANMSEQSVREMKESSEALFHSYITKYPDRCCRLHYDACMHDPGEFERLFQFLDEPYDVSLVNQVLDQRLMHLQKNK